MEWGVPVHSDVRHLELLVLEGAQAGLSWLTVLRRRAGYRDAFADFDPNVLAGFGPERVEAILADPGVIRHRLKIQSAVSNAQAFVRIQAGAGSFDDYIWGMVGGRPLVNRWRSAEEVPATSDLARTVSADLVRRGFRFVGPTICYAYLQAAGMVMDHLTSCFRSRELAGLAQPEPR